MYVIAWTPNFCGVQFIIEEAESHDKMVERVNEIYNGEHEDLSCSVYTTSNEITSKELDLIDSYYNKTPLMKLWVDPKWYNGRDYHDDLIQDARLGKILMKYIDRLNDPIEEPDCNGFTDTTIDIVKEMSLEVDKEVILQKGD